MTKSHEYFEMSNENKEAFLRELYEKEEKSWPQIAEMLGTYVNKISRDAKRFGIVTRSKPEAQKNAINKGVTQHPTKGKQRTAKEKLNIGKALAEKYKDLPEHEKERRRLMSKERWDEMSPDQKEDMRQKSIEAIRATTIEGSKLEKFIHKGLIRAGYKAEFHRKRFVKNEQLEIDIFLPEIGVAVEVDGPSHYEPIWGEERFNKTTAADRMKNGLIIGAGYKMVRIRQKQKANITHNNYTLSLLLEKLEEIKNGKCQEKVIYIKN